MKNLTAGIGFCEGCFYTGIKDGYKPECCICANKEASRKSNIDAIRASLLEYIDELISIEEAGYAYQEKKYRRMQQRIAEKKYAKKAPKSLAIAQAKLDRLPVAAPSADFEAANKRCYNTAKKAVYAYKTSVSISLESLPQKVKFGHSLSSLVNLVSLYGSESDISVLRTALDYNGTLVGLHREGDNGNVLQVKIGFRDKVSKLDFIRKTAAV